MDASINRQNVMNLSPQFEPKKIVKYMKRYTLLEYTVKRILELFIIILISPIVFLVSLYTVYRIKMDSKGSIFYKQMRIGQEGVPFVCYKFRSMHEHNEIKLYTTDDDDRVFTFGNTMRKMRIDELPQLWNVIKGDMHLVGPRAEWDILAQNYAGVIPHYCQRHSVKPGITGLAQVQYPYGRGVKDARNKLRYDLLYIRNWSLALEFKVMWNTLSVIFRKKGV